MECLLSFIRLRNTGLVNAGRYRITVKVILEGMDPENLVLVNWIRKPVHYSVRGRAVSKTFSGNDANVALKSIADGTSIFCIDYDEEDANLNEACLYHFHVTAAELLDKCINPTRLEFTLEYLESEEAGFVPACAAPVVLELPGERYGLMNECAMIFFTSPLYGSATLELSIFFASLSRHCKPQSIFKEVDFSRDASGQFTLSSRRAMKRRLIAFGAPYTHSLAKLKHFAQFCASQEMELAAREDTGPLASENEDEVSVMQRCVEMEQRQDRGEGFFLWHKIQEAFANDRDVLFDIARERWLQRAKDLVGEWSLREKITNSNELLLPQDAMVRAKHYQAVAERLRQAPRFSEYNDEGQAFAGQGTFVDSKGRPVVFEQRFENPRAVNEQAQQQRHEEEDGGLHVIILLHGFLGSRWDLKVFQLVLASLEIPGVRCKAMACNEHNSESDLRTQGADLAKEIMGFCADKDVTRLSFVAYSMGAVVARFALNDSAFKAKFADKLHTFVSVAGPHLGSSGGDSTLVGMGHWVFRRWKKAISLSQLALEDDALLELAKRSEMLAKFKTVALVSSSLDTYVPSFSARVEVPTTTTGFNPRIVEMQRALCANLLKVKTLSKIELDFEFETQSSTQQRVDVLLGRAAHVHILDSIPLTLTLFLNYGEEWFS